MHRNGLIAALVLLVVLVHLDPCAEAETVLQARSEVTLPLTEYLTLMENVDAVARAEAAAAESSVLPVAELAVQETSIVWPEGAHERVAEVSTRFEVLLEGDGLKPVLLPVTGLPGRGEVEPSASASLRKTDRGLELVSSEPGRYVVRVWSHAEIERDDGVNRLEVAPLLAPVGAFEIDAPAASTFRSSRAVIAEESIRQGRRITRFALPRGEGASIEVVSDVTGTSEQRAIAEVSVATQIELGRDGASRHDIFLYRVTRGELSDFQVTLPVGLDPKKLTTDEGDAPLLVDDGVLRVERLEKLTGEGYLVVTSLLPESNEVVLPLLQPDVVVAERFLSLSSSIAAEVTPEPPKDFRRVDVGDVPKGVRDVAPVETHAAWRIVDNVEAATIRIAARPPEKTLDTVVRDRQSLTLLTPDGAVVHRDTFRIRSRSTTWTFRLPAGSELWSARVNEMWVRAVQRGGEVLVPLGFGRNGDHAVEVVAVSKRTLPSGKFRLGLDLGRVTEPVLHHRWRLLLPEDSEYRFATGDLKPVSSRHRSRFRADQVRSRSTWSRSSSMAGPGGSSALRARVMDAEGLVLPGVSVTIVNAETGRSATGTTDGSGHVDFVALLRGNYALTAELSGFATRRIDGLGIDSGEAPAYAIHMDLASVSETITVTGEAPLIDTRSSGTTYSFGTGGGHRRRPPRPQEPEPDTSPLYRYEARGLRAGLANGVKPIPVLIPETGKHLELAGAFPSELVAVVLEVKPR